MTIKIDPADRKKARAEYHWPLLLWWVVKPGRALAKIADEDDDARGVVAVVLGIFFAMAVIGLFVSMLVAGGWLAAVAAGWVAILLYHTIRWLLWKGDS